MTDMQRVLVLVHLASTASTSTSPSYAALWHAEWSGVVWQKKRSETCWTLAERRFALYQLHCTLMIIAERRGGDRAWLVDWLSVRQSVTAGNNKG